MYYTCTCRRIFDFRYCKTPHTNITQVLSNQASSHTSIS